MTDKPWLNLSGRSNSHAKSTKRTFPFLHELCGLANDILASARCCDNNIAFLEHLFGGDQVGGNKNEIFKGQFTINVRCPQYRQVTLLGRIGSLFLRVRDPADCLHHVTKKARRPRSRHNSVFHHAANLALSSPSSFGSWSPQSDCVTINFRIDFPSVLGVLRGSDVGFALNQRIHGITSKRLPPLIRNREKSVSSTVRMRRTPLSPASHTRAASAKSMSRFAYLAIVFESSG